MRRFIVIGIIVLVFIGLLIWLFVISSRPLPGQEALQEGREHLPEGEKLDFKFNPPTSGNHYSAWISKGFYDEPRLDGNLVHSLEHGYIVIWYDCEKKVQSSEFRVQSILATELIKSVYAQGLNMTQGSEGSPSAKLEDMPEGFRNGSCDSLKNQLKEVFNKFGPHKLIIMPRVGMDHPVILTGWGRILKLNNVDQKKIKQFIDAFRDNGPEHTNEP